MKYVILFLTLSLPTQFIGNDHKLDYNEVDYLYKIDLPEITVYPVNQDDVILLAKLIAGEATNEPFEGQIAVVNTVQHRAVRKNKSYKSIVYQKGQYDGVRTSRFKASPNQRHLQAAQAALSGLIVIPYGVQYFHNKRIATDTKHVNSLKPFEYKDIGQHTFCWIPWLKPKV